MSNALPRSRPLGTYAAIIVFVLAYIGVLAVVLAPRDLFGTETGNAVYDTDN